MSICGPCLKVCNVPLCTNEIIIGSISSTDADIRIVVDNKSKGRKVIVDTQSSDTGLVTLVTEGLGLMAGQSYEISVLLSSSPALCDTEIITIGDFTTNCVTVLFENVLAQDGCQVTFESQTLTPIPDMESTPSGCYNVCLLAKALNTDFSSDHSFNFTYEAGRSLQNILPLYARVEFVSGDYSDTNATLKIMDTVNTYFEDIAQFDNSFIAGVRKLFPMLATTPMNIIKTAALTAVITGSTNPGAVADIYIYGIRI